MQVQVRLSAELARLAQRPRLAMEVADGATVGEVLRRLGDDYPALTTHLALAVPFIRGSHAGPQHKIVPDDEVALLLPVAGG